MNTLPAWCVLGLAVLFVGTGWSTNRDAERDDAQRVNISLKELRKHPDDENQLWRLEKFKLCPDYICLKDEDFGDDVWVPVYPAGLDAPPANEDLREIMRFTSIDTRAEWDALRSAPELKIKVCRKRWDDDVAAMTALRNHHYPGLRWDECRLLMAGRNLPTQADAMSSYYASGVLFLIWIGVAIGTVVQKRQPRSVPLSAALRGMAAHD